MRVFKNGNQTAEREDLLRGVRELRAVVTYEGPLGYYLLTDETNNELITEKDLDNIGTESEDINIKEDSIISLKYYCKANIINTICKMITLDTTIDIPVGKEIKVKIGAKNQEDGEFYYVNIGRFYVFSNEFNPDTKSYLITAYDKMYESMIKYDGDINLTFPCTHREFLEAIFDKFGWDYTSQTPYHDEFGSTIFNSDNVTISKDIYLGTDMTYRDVINDLAITYGPLYFNESNVLTLRWLHMSNTYINYEDLKPKVVKITEPYSWDSSILIKKVTLTNSEKMTYTILERGGGNQEFDLGNNLFVQYAMNTNQDYDDVKDDLEIILFNASVICEPAEIDTIGLLTAEPLDWIRIEDEDFYLVKSIQNIENTFTLSKGLTENVTVEEQEEVQKEYVTSTPDTSDVKNAIINIDKANAEIVLKVDSNGNLAEVALNGDKDSGTNVSIKSDSIHLEGIITANQGFKIDQYGNMEATSGKIGNWNIEATQGNTQGALYSDNGNYRVWIQPYQSYYGLDTWIFSVQENGIGKFFVDGRGDISANNIRCGTCYLTSSDTPVSFGYTFTGTPKVVITPRTSASGVIAPKVRSVSTTGFVATIGGSISGTIECDWIAIYD